MFDVGFPAGDHEHEGVSSSVHVEKQNLHNEVVILKTAPEQICSLPSDVLFCAMKTSGMSIPCYNEHCSNETLHLFFRSEECPELYHERAVSLEADKSFQISDSQCHFRFQIRFISDSHRLMQRPL